MTGAVRRARRRRPTASALERTEELLRRLHRAYPDARCALEHADPYQLLVATVLSAQLVQPALRLPWGAERTAEELASAIARDGFDGLFEHGGVAG